MPQRKRGEMGIASEEMKRIGALLAAELETWPGVSVRPMFGMLGVWRGKRIFAALPKTRSLGSERAVLLKFPKLSASLEKRLEANPHIAPFTFGKTKWFQFEVAAERDLRELLEWLAVAAGR